MAVGDPFNIGRSGLLAFQRNLSTISHNITNANTEGYSRQRTLLETRYPTPSASGFIGNGVNISTTERLFDEHAAKQVRVRNSTVSNFSAYTEFAKQVDNLLADQDASLAPAMQSFFDSVQGVADDPTSIPAREVMLTQAEALEDRFHTMAQWLEELQKAANNRIENRIYEINGFAQSIADINREIIVAKGLGGNQEPNDLLDKRDQLIDELSKLIDVQVVEENNGVKNIYIGAGQPLVLGTLDMMLEAAPNPDDPRNYDVYYVDRNASGTRVPVTNSLTGGDLGGVIDFRKEVLWPAQNHLGRLAITITETFNQQHQQGIDMFSALGGDFFDPYGFQQGSQSYRNVPPFGGIIEYRPVDTLQMTTDEYEVTHLGAGNFAVRNMSTKAITNVAVGGPPFVLPPIDGIEIQISGGTPNVNDIFYVRPYREAANDFRLLIDDPSLIAAASAMRTDANINNLGNGVIAEVDIPDVTLLVPASVTIQFRNSAGTPPLQADEFSTDGGATWNPYTSGAPIALNGWTTSISGTPFDGDTFLVEQNNNGLSDNSNAVKLGDLQIAGTMINGDASYADAYSNFVVNVGNSTHQADINLAAQEALLNQAMDYKAAISGVNLDEEAANMLRYQQAYNAAAQVIVAADRMFQTLLNAVGR